MSTSTSVKCVKCYVICDLSGTLFLPTSILAPRSEMNESVVALLHTMRHRGYAIVFMTAKSERKRSMIVERLKQVMLEPDDMHVSLFMREDSDKRPAHEVKQEMLMRVGPDNVLFALEDNPLTMRMLRGHGITCMHVKHPK